MAHPATLEGIPCCTPHSIFQGALEPYADTLVLPGEKTGEISLTDFLAPASLDAALARVGPHFGGTDVRALASLFIIHYVHILMPVTVVAGLLMGRSLPVAYDRVSVVLDEEGLPDHFVLPDEGHTDASPDPFVRFGPLVFDHLEPVFAAVAARSGLSPRVLWTNAANLFEAILRETEGWGLNPEAVAAAEALVASPRWPDGRRNPFHAPVRYAEGTGRRAALAPGLLRALPAAASQILPQLPPPPRRRQGRRRIRDRTGRSGRILYQ